MISKRRDIALGRVLRISPKMIRFYAARMILELGLGKKISQDVQRKVFNKCSVDILEAGF